MYIEGDEYTTFFHKYAAAKKRENSIADILSEQSSNLTSNAEIGNEVISFYKSHYRRKHDTRFLPYCFSGILLVVMNVDPLKNPSPLKKSRH